MKKNNYKYLLMVLILMLTNCSALDSHKFVETAECTVSIPNNFKIDEKLSQYEYIYSKINYDEEGFKTKPRSYILIKNKIPNYYSYWMNEISKSKEMILVSEKKRSHFIILEVSLNFDQENENDYYLIGEKSTFFLSNCSKKEVNHIIDYCDKTRK